MWGPLVLEYLSVSPLTKLLNFALFFVCFYFKNGQSPIVLAGFSQVRIREQVSQDEHSRGSPPLPWLLACGSSLC